MYVHFSLTERWDGNRFQELSFAIFSPYKIFPNLSDLPSGIQLNNFTRSAGTNTGDLQRVYQDIYFDCGNASEEEINIAIRELQKIFDWRTKSPQKNGQNAEEVRNNFKQIWAAQLQKVISERPVKAPVLEEKKATQQSNSVPKIANTGYSICNAFRRLCPSRSVKQSVEVSAAARKTL